MIHKLTTISRGKRLIKKYLKVSGSIITDPNPIINQDTGLGTTTLSWTSKRTEQVEVHIIAPDGPLLSRTGSSGSATTGKWVQDGMVFYLQDVTGGKPLIPKHTLAKVTVRVRMLRGIHEFAAYLGERFGCTSIVDYGCVDVRKLTALHFRFSIVGVCSGNDAKTYQKRYEFGTWIECNLNSFHEISIPVEVLKKSVIVGHNIIGQMKNPTYLLDSMKRLMELSPICLIADQKKNLEKLLQSKVFNVVFTGTTWEDRFFQKKTFISIIEKNQDISINKTFTQSPPDFHVVAIMTAYNEEDIIAPSIEHLIRQGIEVYLIDNWSTDGTFESARKFIGKGLITIERFPKEGPSAFYNWKDLLRRVEEISREIKADWFIHHDADEVRMSPWPSVSLKDGIYAVDQAGFNCIDHTVLEFHPVDNNFIPGTDFEKYFKYFEFSKHRSDFIRINTWKNFGRRTSLAESGGHEVMFEGRRAYPYKFLLKHYRIRSQFHGEKKVFRERKLRWNPEERAMGWHTHYDDVQNSQFFLRLPHTLKIFDTAFFYKEYLIERLSGIGVILTKPIEQQQQIKDPKSRGLGKKRRDAQVKKTGKLMTAKRFVRLIFWNPGMTLRLMRPHLLKKAWIFLVNNSWNFRQFIKRAEELYFRQEPKIILTESIHPLISYYGLPRSSEDEIAALPNNDEIDEWTGNLRRLVSSLPKESAKPKASIVIPVYNQIRFTLACLHSIFANAGRDDYEIIISDDNSTDQTFDVFKNNFPRVRYFRNEKNLGFLRNCNNAAQKILGQYIIFLNNDTVVCPGWLDELMKTLDKEPSVGVVGSKLIFPQGILQEAGGIIFDDGSGWNYGRFENPCLPQFNYMRDVDYCSGASLAISAKLWRQLGGFDTRFSPAYYEDTDLAFRVREAGYRVVYQPLSEVLHFEGISNGKSDHSGIKKYQVANKQKFHSKWKHVLAAHGACNPESLPADRSVKGRVLVIDATTPTPDKDSGSMDAYNYMMIMRGLGFHVTFVPESVVFFDEYTRDLQRRGVECSYLPWVHSPKEAVERYAPEADIVMLCRVNVAAPLVDVVRHHAPRAQIIFDTVDLHFLRESRKAELLGSSTLVDTVANTRDIELDVIRKVDATILRSTYEMELLKEMVPEARLFNFPIAREIPGLSGIPWKERRDIVFIGGFAHPPNADAVKYFVSEVWPILRASGFLERFIIAGSNVPDEIAALASDDIIVCGFVKDLSDIFGKCRLSVAPLRYGAGVKGKVVTSLSYGVPCVATKIAAEGSGLVHNENILVSDDADEMAQMIQTLCANQQLWEKLSQSGLLYCEEKFSIRAVKEIINKAFSELLGPKELIADNVGNKRSQ